MKFMEKLTIFIERVWQQKKKIVLVTGVFDLLHQEHIIFLVKAKEAGDVLVVGIETDKRVKKLKGIDRPINDQFKRQQQVGDLPVVDLAFILPEGFSSKQEQLNLLKLIKPQILAVSSHTLHLKQKRLLMRQVGGKVRVVYQHNPNISTTLMLRW